MTNNRTSTAKPAVEVRAGGLHLTIKRIPYGVIAFIAGVISAIGGSTWLGQ